MTLFNKKFFMGLIIGFVGIISLAFGVNAITINNPPLDTDSMEHVLNVFRNIAIWILIVYSGVKVLQPASKHEYKIAGKNLICFLCVYACIVIIPIILKLIVKI